MKATVYRVLPFMPHAFIFALCIHSYLRATDGTVDRAWLFVVGAWVANAALSKLNARHVERQRDELNAEIKEWVALAEQQSELLEKIRRRS